ncbi:MAG TPA: response regulator [Steroidobacteraceae bacterium]
MNDILIIDDEDDIREALRRVLERAGYRIRTAEDGADGLTKMQQRAADIIITDIIMPKLNGVETIAAMRERYPHARIIAISGGGNFGVTDYQPDAITTSAYLAAANKAGAHIILTKPFDSADLLKAIADLVQSGRA